MRTHIPQSALALLALASTAAAQSKQPPIRQLGAVSATTKEVFGAIAGVRPLPGGRLLVNDPAGRRVLLLDSTLAVVTVVADSTSATGNAYSGRIAGLIPYRGDSTLFIDPQSLSMLVVDPAGKLGRTLSVPRSEDAMSLAGFPSGAGWDPAGRIVYRAGFRFGGRPPLPGQPLTPPDIPDTSAILRIDLATRKVDTLAWFKTPKVSLRISTDDQGRTTMQSEINPLPVVDDWAMLPDGAVAIIRGRDYHVDYVAPDGTRQSAPKMPFDWQRLTDDDKVAFIDSVKAARARLLAAQQGAQGAAQSGSVNVTTSTTNGQTRTSAAAAPLAGGDGGGPQIVMRTGPGGPGGAVAPPAPIFVAPSELPDYKPPFFAGSARADLEGNLWIRTIPTRAIPGGPIYDVVSRKGELVDRVQLPVNTQIVGFGADGSVYLLARDPAVTPAKTTLQRARLR